MRQWVMAAAALLLVQTAARGQDMPLYTVLIEGEEWTPVSTTTPPGRNLFVAPIALLQRDATARTRPVFIKASKPLSTALSPDAGTLFVGFDDDAAVWAYRIDANANISGGAPYCPLRLRPGQTGTAVTSIATDRVGRIFAATPEGIHFFDPTGRFSGLIFLPTKGSPSGLAFEDDKLVVWVGDTKYARKLNTRGK